MVSSISSLSTSNSSQIDSVDDKKSTCWGSTWRVIKGVGKGLTLTGTGLMWAGVVIAALAYFAAMTTTSIYAPFFYIAITIGAAALIPLGAGCITVGAPTWVITYNILKRKKT